MTQRERLEKLNAAQRQFLIEQLRARKLLKRKQGRSQLVAIVSGCESHQQSHLNDYFGTMLPDYMLPSQWHFVDELPRNANGKLDRHALARLHTSQLHAESANHPSADSKGDNNDSKSDSQIREIEHTLSAIWAEVLFMDDVQTDDDYFELGGDSIASMQIVARAAKQGLVFTTQDIMRFPNIRQLSQRVIALLSGGRDATQPSAEQDTESTADIMRVLNLGD